MTNVEARGIKYVVAPAANGVVFGFGTYSYVLGLEAMLHLLSTAERPNQALQPMRGTRG
jgi:3-dehydroquinate dehydratase